MVVVMDPAHPLTCLPRQSFPTPQAAVASLVARRSRTLLQRQSLLPRQCFSPSNPVAGVSGILGVVIPRLRGLAANETLVPLSAVGCELRSQEAVAKSWTVGVALSCGCRRALSSYLRPGIEGALMMLCSPPLV